jgi:hypothetical protein
LKIGISYWGYLEKWEDAKASATPDGHRFGRPLMVDELIARGHEVIALQQRREETPYPGVTYSNDLPEIDALLVEWRWITHKNSVYGDVLLGDEPDYLRQKELLEHYCGNIPVVIWDMDMKMTIEDEKILNKYDNITIFDPCISPRTVAGMTRIPYPFFFKPGKKFSWCKHPGYSYTYGYVGNNYERALQFEKYYAFPAGSLRSIGIQTRVNGNWLQRSKERFDPSLLIQSYPNVMFGDRLDFKQSMNFLSSCICTTHIAKDEYSKHGFVTARYMEAIAANVPAIVPHEFAYSEILGASSVADSTSDLIKKVRVHSEQMIWRSEVVEAQEYELLKFGNAHGLTFDVVSAVDQFLDVL